MEKPLRSATSPDGLLTLELYANDEVTIGFKGHDWHTHGDLLMPVYGDSPLAAANGFFDAVLQDRQPICILSVTGQAWVTDDLLDELSAPEASDLVVRVWSGKGWEQA
jgi:hypothetical protein